MNFVHDFANILTQICCKQALKLLTPTKNIEFSQFKGKIILE